MFYPGGIRIARGIRLSIGGLHTVYRAWVFLVSLVWLLPVQAELRIAVADSFYAPLQQIAARYQQHYGQTLQLVPGATGDLYSQILAGENYDLFFSSDLERPRKLIMNGQGDADSFMVYAMGEVALWCPRHGGKPRLQDVEDAGTLALANPLTSPYGEAARRLLTRAGIWDRIKSRVLLQDSTTEVISAVRGGLASCGFVAYNQWLGLPEKRQDRIWREPMRQDALLKQAVIAIKSSPRRMEARDFLVFVQSPEIHALIESLGYRVTAAPLAPPPVDNFPEPEF